MFWQQLADRLGTSKADAKRLATLGAVSWAEAMDEQSKLWLANIDEFRCDASHPVAELQVRRGDEWFSFDEDPPPPIVEYLAQCLTTLKFTNKVDLKESIEGIISYGERGNVPLAEQAEAILKLFDRFLESSRS